VVIILPEPLPPAHYEERNFFWLAKKTFPPLYLSPTIHKFANEFIPSELSALCLESHGRETCRRAQVESLGAERLGALRSERIRPIVSGKICDRICESKH
jgi:hypothetical protein